MTAAPPRTCRRSSSEDLVAGVRQIGRVDEAVVAAADHDYVIVLRHSLDSSGMNPHMLGEKDAAGRRDSLLGSERWAQGHAEVEPWVRLPCERESLYFGFEKGWRFRRDWCR